VSLGRILSEFGDAVRVLRTFQLRAQPKHNRTKRDKKLISQTGFLSVLAHLYAFGPQSKAPQTILWTVCPSIASL